MTAPLLILDFDGVVNILGGRRATERHAAALGHIVRTELECEGAYYPVLYSRELVRRINASVVASGAGFVWLTTWNECSLSSINPALGLHGSDWIRWDSRSGRSPTASDDERSLARAGAKYRAVIAHIEEDPRPFVWVDDEAADEFDERDFRELQPDAMLAIAPDPSVGISAVELASIEGFLARFR